MGDPKGFLKIQKRSADCRPVADRLRDYREVTLLRIDRHNREQGARCMDCGIPFCSWACPIANDIPEWNEYLDEGNWHQAFRLLGEHHVIPEVTGRICPAPCEYGCVLGITDDPVTIRENELAIVEWAFREGVVRPRQPVHRRRESIAVVGSGPAGLICAVTLNRQGYHVTVIERDDRIGGLLRYGIPDFKLEKGLLDRRIEIWKEEGIEFLTRNHVGVDTKAAELLREYDAVCLAGGSKVPRDLPIEGRNLAGIHFAMDFLTQSNRRVMGEQCCAAELIDAAGKNVVVIGGGDTGADCIGTANRQGAASVTQIELLPKPPEDRPPDQPWPLYPKILKTQSSHEEGVERLWSIGEKRFAGTHGKVSGVDCVELRFSEHEAGRLSFEEVTGTEFTLPAELVLLAMGFLGPEREGMVAELGVQLDPRGNVKTDPNYMTSVSRVFAAGDMRRGQSLVVWACREGKEAAFGISRYLTHR